jgi:hypothetical protein
MSTRTASPALVHMPTITARGRHAGRTPSVGWFEMDRRAHLGDQRTAAARHPRSQLGFSAGASCVAARAHAHDPPPQRSQPSAAGVHRRWATEPTEPPWWACFRGRAKPSAGQAAVPGGLRDGAGGGARVRCRRATLQGAQRAHQFSRRARAAAPQAHLLCCPWRQRLGHLRLVPRA